MTIEVSMARAPSSRPDRPVGRRRCARSPRGSRRAMRASAGAVWMVIACISVADGGRRVAPETIRLARSRRRADIGQRRVGSFVHVASSERRRAARAAANLTVLS
jgi:hypothetical protein